MTPRVLTIGGIDSSGAAGLTQDQRALHYFGVQQQQVISLIATQSHNRLHHVMAVSDDSFEAQLQTAFNNAPPAGIKIGALANDNQIYAIVTQLQNHPAIPVVWDPITQTSSKGKLGELSFDAIARLLPHAHIITPNVDELAYLTGFALKNQTDELAAAHELIALGCRYVVVKGGHRKVGGNLYDALYSSEEYWRFAHRMHHPFSLRGSGCLLASSLSGALAKGYNVEDALCQAEAIVAAAFENAVRVSANQVALDSAAPVPLETHYPSVFKGFNEFENSYSFAPLRNKELGLYPVVDSIAWLKRLLPLGIRIIQLRIKHPGEHLNQTIKDAIALAKETDTQLFINDYWELAIAHGAYGVHLGQDDLATANLHAIAKAGLRLGISTHGYAELCRARELSPSYIALGHIFATKTKNMPSKPQGIERLAAYRLLCGHIPTVAIGGINQQNIHGVAATGVDGIAVVTAITESDDVNGAVVALKRSIANANH